MNGKRPLTAADLYHLRLVSDPQISPDGGRVAYVVQQMNEKTNEYVGNIYVADRDGAVTQFTSGDKDSAPRWSPDGRYLAFLSGRKDEAQVHLMPSAGGESVPITSAPLGAGTPVWSPDSRSIAFAAMVSIRDEGAEAEKEDGKKEPTMVFDRASYKLDTAGFLWDRRRHLFVVDVASRETRPLTEGDFFDVDPRWSPDSQLLVFSSNRSPNWDVSAGSDIYVIAAEGGEAQRIVSGGAYDNPVFSPDGSRIAFVGHDTPDIYGPPRLFSATRSGDDLRDELGEWQGGLGNQVVSDVARSPDVLELSWRQDGLYFLATVRGECGVYRAHEGTVTAVTPGPHTVTGYSFDDRGSIAFTCSDAIHPPDVYLRYDDATAQLTHENDALLQDVFIARPERFTFRGANEEESEGWLLPPHGWESGRHPLIVYIHGGPATAHGEAFHFEYQFLAGLGFGVFYPNIHGSSSYSDDYQTSIRYDWGNLDYQDVLAGTEAAVDRPWVDPARVGIAGGSYGGYMTNWVMTHTDRFKAGVTERCLSNAVSFVGTSDHGWWWKQAWGAYPEEDVQKLWDMSPIKYVTAVQGPLMVVHSMRDDRCPVEQGEQMFNALRRLGKDTKFVVFPEESHELSRSGTPSRRVERLGYISGWFQEKL
jgi:dipeptidyl aminopeptidase/acylaminoacyl peptidase